MLHITRKQRVRTRLKRALRISPNRRDSDNDTLASAMKNYKSMKKKLKQLQTVLKRYHESIEQMHKSRAEVVSMVSELSVSTPLFEHVGDVMRDDDDENKRSDMLPSFHAVSLSPMPQRQHEYVSIHADATQRSLRLLHECFVGRVVGHVHEWDRTVKERVSTALKEVRRSRLELDHYAAKVEGMQRLDNYEDNATANATANAKVRVDRRSRRRYRQEQRLHRNESKLRNSRAKHDACVHKICALVEATTIQSTTTSSDCFWKEFVFPLLLELVRYDVAVTKSEAQTSEEMETLVESLDEMARRYHVNREDNNNGGLTFPRIRSHGRSSRKGGYDHRWGLCQDPSVERSRRAYLRPLTSLTDTTTATSTDSHSRSTSSLLDEFLCAASLTIPEIYVDDDTSIDNEKIALSDTHGVEDSGHEHEDGKKHSLVVVAACVEPSAPNPPSPQPPHARIENLSILASSERAHGHCRIVEGPSVQTERLSNDASLPPTTVVGPAVGLVPTSPPPVPPPMMVATGRAATTTTAPANPESESPVHVVVVATTNATNADSQPKIQRQEEGGATTLDVIATTVTDTTTIITRGAFQNPFKEF